MWPESWVFRSLGFVMIQGMDFGVDRSGFKCDTLLASCGLWEVTQLHQTLVSSFVKLSYLPSKA